MQDLSATPPIPIGSRRHNTISCLADSGNTNCCCSTATVANVCCNSVGSTTSTTNHHQHHNIGKALTSFIMFFENSRRYNCELESQRKFNSISSKTGRQLILSEFGIASVSSDNAHVVLRSKTPITDDCHGHDESAMRFKLAAATMTTGANCLNTAANIGLPAPKPAPKPAPRKSLHNRHVVFNRLDGVSDGDIDEENAINCDTDKNSNQMTEFAYNTVKLRALRFQQNQIEICDAKHQRLKRSNELKNLMKQPTNSTHFNCNSGATTENQKDISSSYDDRLLSKAAHSNHDAIAASSSSFVDDESDGSSSTDNDTEDSQDNKLDRPKPGKLDLRQFDNITTAIGKLNVQTTSSPAAALTKTPTTTSASKQQHQSSDDGARNNRRVSKNLRQNHGRAVAPPKLPAGIVSSKTGSATTTSTGVSSSSNKSINTSKLSNLKIPVNETIGQLNNENNSAIDFSQSPIARRLLKHSKDHKVSELLSPYGSDSEQQAVQHQFSRNFVRGNSELGRKDSEFIRNSSLDSSELVNSRGAAIRSQLNEILANKQSLGQRPGVAKTATKGGSLDQSDQPTATGSDAKKIDKDSKKDKKKIRSDEKLEKRKLKEEERQRRQEEEKLRRQEKKLAAKKSKSSTTGPNSVGDDGVPLFIKRCIEFIESEGLDAEGIYRVPGNRAHVDAFVQKFKENPDMSIVESDIPVNAVATALKDFLSKKWGPIIPSDLMNELTELSNISDKDRRKEAVRDLIRKLPAANYALLKYVFAHFVRVSHNHSLNSMDSKNLAICWWPTLLPLQFNDMVMFEQMRPHLEESIQTMIDQYDFIFQNDAPPAATP